MAYLKYGIIQVRLPADMLNKNQHTHKDVSLPFDSFTIKKQANHRHRFADNDRVLGNNMLSIPFVTIAVILKKKNLYGYKHQIFFIWTSYFLMTSVLTYGSL
jgi:hypothetical protein